MRAIVGSENAAPRHLCFDSAVRGPFVFWTRAVRKRKVRQFRAFELHRRLTIFLTAALGFASFGWGQTPAHKLDPQVLAPQTAGPASTGNQMPAPQSSGSLQGTVIDPSGAVLEGAQIKLTTERQSLTALSDAEGQFSFSNIIAAPFQLTVTLSGFAQQTTSGVLHPSEIQTVPQIQLQVAEARTEVQVHLTRPEVAEEQLKIEEKQRVLGAIPNFYVSYIPDAAPLTAKQKFKLATRTVIDPFTVVVVAGAAGVEQAQNHFSGYGQGAQGYAKRFGAGYADTLTSTFIGAAILPSLLKQDPRYFYKGTGSVASRGLYALANSIICKGDNGRWQPNYSNVLGSMAAGGLSNLYYPEQNRDGADLTLENAAIAIGATAIGNLFQEFVIRKLTPKLPKHDPATP